MKDIDKLNKENPYLSNFVNSLSEHLEITNYGKKSYGFIDVYSYFFQSKIFFLNWVENIKFYNVPFFIVFIFLGKCFNKKIIWTHHNLEPHDGGTFSSRLILNILKKYSTNILIHTKESYYSFDSRYHDKLIYLKHPFFDSLNYKEEIKSYDLLIWGAMRKSKGVKEFFQFLKDTNTKDLKILLVGKFQDDIYYQEVLKLIENNHNIKIENRFVEESEFYTIHHICKKIVFIYNGSSVLNSGALIKSLASGIPIIGPNRGAFIDYSNLGLVDVFNSYEDLLQLINQKSLENRLIVLDNLVVQNNWNNFALALIKNLN